MHPKVVLSVPKIARRKLTWVTATLANWAVTCDDPEIAAQVEELKPENLNYLPYQELTWAHECERWLAARIVTVEPPPSDGPDLGVCFSGEPLLNVPVCAEAGDGTIGDGVMTLGPGQPDYEVAKQSQARVRRVRGAHPGVRRSCR
jgi:hypothetical protein